MLYVTVTLQGVSNNTIRRQRQQDTTSTQYKLGDSYDTDKVTSSSTKVQSCLSTNYSNLDNTKHYRVHTRKDGIKKKQAQGRQEWNPTTI